MKLTHAPSCPMVAPRALPLLLFSLLKIQHGTAMIPTAEIDIVTVSNNAKNPEYTLMASQASFGSEPPMRGMDGSSSNGVSDTLRLQLSPDDNLDMCSLPSPTATFLETDTTTSTNIDGTIVLVPRGKCTFQTKAYHAQKMGAKAMIVYGALSSHYSLNTTTPETTTSNDEGKEEVTNKDAEEKVSYTMDDIIWPVNLGDYDCSKGRAVIPENALSFDPLPYNARINDPLLSGNTTQNLCLRKSPDALKNCPSKACLVTGKKESNGDWEACCAWDLHIWLFTDPVFYRHNTSLEPVTIPSTYVTLTEALQLRKELQTNDMVLLSIYERWRPLYNPSSAMIWVLAVTVAAAAAYLSAHDYHAKTRRVLRANERRLKEGGDRNRRQQQQQQQEPARPAPAVQPEETLELNAWHALGFLIMASTSLLVLFFFKIYGVVKIMYAFGCSKALSTILLTPLIRRIFGHFKIPNRVVYVSNIEEIGEVTVRDVLAHVIGYSFGLAWLIVAFSYYHPETIAFFWIMQDIFGACMCILFLQVVKLNSIRVAALLLVVAFFYDIFFVFITPLIFKRSVMIDVATSGGPPPNPEWCEKYPDDPVDCQQRGNPLPMLFTIPRIADYQGGANLLGLGDIVVPGLLISFAARFDAAKRLLGVMGGGNGSLASYTCPQQRYCGSTCWNGGYFVPVVIAYAIGLLMANAAVYLMEMGQPALLYLVPCCLGMVLFIGWKRKELNDLWEGPKAIRAADTICYGESVDGASGASHAPIPQDDHDGEDGDEGGHQMMEALAVPSASDDIGDGKQ